MQKEIKAMSGWSVKVTTKGVYINGEKQNKEKSAEIEGAFRQAIGPDIYDMVKKEKE